MILKCFSIFHKHLLVDVDFGIGRASVQRPMQFSGTPSSLQHVLLKVKPKVFIYDKIVELIVIHFYFYLVLVTINQVT